MPNTKRSRSAAGGLPKAAKQPRRLSWDKEALLGRPIRKAHAKCAGAPPLARLRARRSRPGR